MGSEEKNYTQIQSKDALIDYLKLHGVTLYAWRKPKTKFLSWNENTDERELIFATPNNPGGVQIPEIHQFFPSDTPDGLYPIKSSVWVPRPLFDQLNKELMDEESEVRRLSNVPIRRGFVYVDISDFSKYKTGEQLLVIKSLIPAVNNAEHWENPNPRKARESLESCLCIGDGYIYVLKDVGYTLYFTAYLATLLEHAGSILKKDVPIQFHFRMGAHVGEVCCFWDQYQPGAGRWNYSGEGINGGQRVLASIGKEVDNVAFISYDVREEVLRNKPDIDDVLRKQWLQNLINVGRREDKHKRPWRVYQVNHLGIASDDIPDLFKPAPKMDAKSSEG